MKWWRAFVQWIKRLFHREPEWVDAVGTVGSDHPTPTPRKRQRNHNTPGAFGYQGERFRGDR